MPELPEVETVRTAIEAAAQGHSIASVWSSDKPMRWPIPLDISGVLSGGVISSVLRRGKYIILLITHRGNKPDRAVIIHLGMSGSVRIYPHGLGGDSGVNQRPHDHLIIKTTASRGGKWLVLNDPRRFGGVQVTAADSYAAHPLIAGMGVEPLGDMLTPDRLYGAFRGRCIPIKSALLDQKIIAGIGNIYASEALFLAGISPRRLAKNIGLPRLTRLCDSVRQVLLAAIAAGGTSLRDHIQPGGEIGYFAQQLNVYGRDGGDCPNCQSPIKTIRQSGRATFYCPCCQR